MTLITKRLLQPNASNLQGKLLGGELINDMVVAGMLAADHLTSYDLVTVSVGEVTFKEPVFGDDQISIFAEILKVGTTSVRVKVSIDVRRGEGSDSKMVTLASTEIVYVATYKDVYGNVIKTNVRGSSSPAPE